MDRRLTPANDRVAAASLQGRVQAKTFVDGWQAHVTCPVLDLCKAPGGARDRQVVMGQTLQVYDVQDGWAFVQSSVDGYVGYVLACNLDTGDAGATHLVSARATHVYAKADFKSAERISLPLGAAIQVLDLDGKFVRTSQGFIPAQHVHEIADGPMASDPVAVAETLLGVPYLWGGNSSFGLDCSGLIQAGLLACGRACPGDSDLQEAALGDTLPLGTAPQRGDVLFWKGHVAWVADPHTLLHANVHHMAVAYEPLETALDRIVTQGDGPVTRHARNV